MAAAYAHSQYIAVAHTLEMGRNKAVHADRQGCRAALNKAPNKAYIAEPHLHPPLDNRSVSRRIKMMPRDT
jgi:hypothetical protein